ncbi:MAG: hypothetical protein ACLS89_02100 [Collinsella sp.]
MAVEAVPLEEDFDTLVASLAIDDTLEDKLAKLKKNVDEKLADYRDVKRIEGRGLQGGEEVPRGGQRREEAHRGSARPRRRSTATCSRRSTRPSARSRRPSTSYPMSTRPRSTDTTASAGNAASPRSRATTTTSRARWDLWCPQRIADDRWLNASFGEVKAKNIIERRVGELLHQFRFVNGLDYATSPRRRGPWRGGRGRCRRTRARCGCGRRASRGGRRPPRSRRPTSRRRRPRGASARAGGRRASRA